MGGGGADRRVAFWQQWRRLTLPGAAASLVWALLLATLLAHALLGVTPGSFAAPIAVNLSLAASLSWVVLFRLDDHTLARAWSWLLAGLLIAALLNALAALVQTAAPAWADDRLIASLAGPRERAGGNLRQPNQLATLMVWALSPRPVCCAVGRCCGFSACATLHACRARQRLTGRNHQSRRGRDDRCVRLAAFTPQTQMTMAEVTAVAPAAVVAGVLAILLLALLGWAAQHAFSRDTADASLAQRLALWQQTLGLIMQHPWAGVGWAQLNFVWTLTPFADRAPDVFDHAHSLPLHLAVEPRYPGNSRCCNAGHRRALAGTGPARSVRKRRTGPHRRCRPAAAQHRYTQPVSNTRSGSSYFPVAHCILCWQHLPATWQQRRRACSVDHQHSTRRQIDVGAVDRVHGDAAVDRNRLGRARIQQGVGHSFHRQRSRRAPTPLLLPAPARSTVSNGDYAAIMLAGIGRRLSGSRGRSAMFSTSGCSQPGHEHCNAPGQHERAAWVVARAREFPPDRNVCRLAAGDRATQSGVSTTQR